MKQNTMTVLLLLCAAQIFAQVGRTGVITELSGTVELMGAGGGVFVPAKVGDPVFADTTVSTGFKSTALITAGSSTFMVRPLTRMTLAELRSSTERGLLTETINVDLQAGRVRVDVRPPVGFKTSLSVQSPTATASVRGTSFEFDTQSLTVFEGTVAFQGSKGGAKLVSAGSTHDVNENGRVVDPVESYAAGLLPPMPAGSDSGFRRGRNHGGRL